MIEKEFLKQINLVLAVQKHFSTSPKESFSAKEHLKDIIAACEILLSTLDE